MLPPLKRVTGTDPVVIAPEILQALIDEVARLGKLTVIPPLMLSDDDTGRTLSARIGGIGDFFLVRVEQTGGTAGSNVFPASFTYSVRSLSWNGELASGETDSPLGENVQVYPPRAVGRRIAQEGSIGLGIAFRDESGTLWLWDAGEKDDTSFCSQMEGSGS